MNNLTDSCKCLAQTYAKLFITNGFLQGLGLAFFFLGLTACAPAYRGLYVTLEGPAQGTNYRIVYADPAGRNFQNDLDSILQRVNDGLSTYQANSVINQFNASEVGLETDDELFWEMIRQSDQMYHLSEGAFDPTVMPLVRAWGFGPDKVPEPKVENIDSLRTLVGFDQLTFSLPAEVGNTGRLDKAQKGLQLDFNAIAQGYTVDLIGEHFRKSGISHFMIELGGEVLTAGLNPEGKVWTLGIEKPIDIPGIQILAATIELENRSLATSGSYKKYYVKEGVKYSHTIDPASGKPVAHRLLSVTVVTDKCARADALATVFMVWGEERSRRFLETNPEQGIEAYFISSGEEQGYDFYLTPGMEEILKAVP